MKYYAVIDTNVIISSMLKENSLPWIIVQNVIDQNIIPLLNDEILNEYAEVLMREEFGFEITDINNLINGIKDNALYLDATKTDELFSDKNDVVFYEIVMTARNHTDAYLITGNTKHFPTKPFVVTPRQMLEIMDLL